MALRLTIFENGNIAEQYKRNFLQDKIVIGRSRSVDVCLPDLAVSVRHAEIVLEKNEYAVMDSGSVNGTWVNGRELVPHRPRILQDGDVISVASFSLKFENGAGAGPMESRDASTDHAMRMMSSVLTRCGEDARREQVERSLGLIFEMPEEQTSSFSKDYGEGGKTEKGPLTPSPTPMEGKKRDPLPVGPVDPLVETVRRDFDEEMHTGSYRENGSDVGLIVVGVLIVIASVAGLVYLFS
jgi:pSer/pThr/pTyr-binding forkhead associated (FHA) protein